MIAEDQNKALLYLAEAFQEEENYQKFLILREKGLKKQAFAHLEAFVKEFQQKNEEKQLQFIEKFFSFDGKLPYDVVYVGLPYPFSRILFPLLKQFCEKYPDNADLHYWYGSKMQEIEYIHKALHINPELEKAKIYLIEQKLKWLDHATHHLPDYYITDGEEAEDLALCNALKAEIEALKDEKQKDFYQKERQGFQELVENYILWKQSGTSDLKKWGEENQKRVSSGIIAVYYDK